MTPLKFLLIIEFSFCLILAQTIIFHNDSIPKSGFGLYFITIQKLEFCNITDEPIDNGGSLEVTRISQGDQHDTFVWNFTFKNDVQLINSSVYAEIWKNGKFSEIFRQSTNNPCTNKYFKYDIPSEFIKDASQCIIKKGSFTNEIDLNNNVHRIVGSKFFYGYGKALTKHYTPKGVGLCYILDIMTRPIKKKINKE